jgi:hypothetical protein
MSKVQSQPLGLPTTSIFSLAAAREKIDFVLAPRAPGNDAAAEKQYHPQITQITTYQSAVTGRESA